MIGSQDLLIGLVIVVFLFGARRLPELASSLGKSMKEFKKGVADATEDRPAPEPAPIPIAATSVACAACKAPLHADWSHCPRCGEKAPEAATPSSRS